MRVMKSFFDLIRMLGKLNSVFLLIFGIPCLLVGLGLFPDGVSSLWKYAKSAAWEPVNAYATDVKMETRGSGGKTSHWLKGEYSYFYNGRQFSSRHLTVDGEECSWEGVGETLFARFQESKTNKTPFPVLVNPTNPSQAMALRTMSGMMVFNSFLGLLFLAAGIVIVTLVRMSAVSHATRMKLADQFPGRPWKWEYKWGKLEAVSDERLKRLGIWVFACLWGGIAATLLILALRDPGTSQFEKAVPALLSLFGAVMLGVSSYYSLRYLKYGEPRLLLPQIPFESGKRFSGVVLVKRRLVAEKGVSLTLQCLQTNTDMGGNWKLDTCTRTLYEKQVMAFPDIDRSGMDRSAIPVSFDIPENLPKTEEEGLQRIEWKLFVNASTPGIDFYAEFELPVYRVSNPSLIEYRTGEEP